MALEKASLQADQEAEIPVLFNPTQYGLDSGNQYAEIGIPGLGAPLLQYVRGNSRTMSIELFCDTYEAGSDVRKFTNAIYDLLSIRSETHVPPICTFRWGSFQFRGIVERVSGRFTLFLADGTPVRATLTLGMKEFVDVSVEVRRTPTNSPDRTKAYTVQRGDTLYGIAAANYGDPAQWRPIANANAIDDPLALAPGSVLTIPRIT
jgi:LysM repeat protein